MLRIEMLRKELGLSQEEFAKKVSMTQQRISAYEKEKREPDLETIKQFADFFNVSTDYLLGKSDIRNPEEIQLSGLELTQDDINFIKKIKPLSEQNRKFLEKMIETFDDISSNAKE